MPRPPPSASRSRIIAGFVTIAGVVAIWAFSAARQQDQTEALSRQWVGEQWDVARHCLLGTPIGRGQDAEAIAALLDRMLVDTLARASEADEPPERDALWPARCAPLLPSLRADRSILEADPGDALTVLDVLAPRVLEIGSEGPSQLLVGAARERARELAEPIARLDAAMPAGAEYDVRRYAPPEGRISASLVLDSLACPPSPAPRRLFAPPSGGDELFDELDVGARSLRLSGALDGPMQLTAASDEGTQVTPLRRDGARHALFWDADTLLWLDAATPRVNLQDLGDTEAGPSVTLDGGAPIDRIALCRAESAHFIARRGDRYAWIAWAGPGHAPGPAVDLGAAPPPSAIAACDRDTLIVSWPRDDGWHGVVCSRERCAPMPRLRAGGDLQLAVAGEVLAVARGRRTDLPLARTLREDGGPFTWSPPSVVARGALSASDGGFRLDVCGDAGAFTSDDGLVWRGEH